MKHLFTKIFLFHLLLIGAVQVTAQNKKSGNPILPGPMPTPKFCILIRQNAIIFTPPVTDFQDGAEVILRSFHQRI